MRPWMICYVLLGLVQTGMLPIILPLSAPAGPAAGLTYAAYSIAGIAAPFVGAASDRTRRHRLTLPAGLGLAALGLLVQRALPPGIAWHCLDAAAIGLGVSSASTVGTMFVVEVEEEAAWEQGISALQGATSAGQLAGLLIAGLFGLRLVGISFLAAGLALALAVPLALALAPHPVAPVARRDLPPRPTRSGDLANGGPQRSLHRATRAAIAALAHNRLAAFLLIWLLSYTATNALSVMFAPAMVRDFHAPALWATGAYAAGVGASLLLYAPVGRWDRAYGPFHVLAGGFCLRIVTVGAMAAAAALGGADIRVVLLLAFAAMQTSWPLLSVASTALAVRLSPAHPAGSVGLLNATSSIGATLGGIVGGSLLGAGFGWFCAIVVACVAASLALTRGRLERPSAPA